MVRTLEIFEDELEFRDVLAIKQRIPQLSAFIGAISSDTENLTNFGILYTPELLVNYLARGGSAEEGIISQAGLFSTSADLAPILQMLPRDRGQNLDLGRLTSQVRSLQGRSTLQVGAYVQRERVFGLALYFQD
jgi:hypothetical protein